MMHIRSHFARLFAPLAFSALASMSAHADDTEANAAANDDANAEASDGVEDDVGASANADASADVDAKADTDAADASTNPVPNPVANSVVLEARPGRGVTVRTTDDQYGVRAWTRTDLRADMVEARPFTDLPVSDVEFRRVALFIDGHAFGPHNRMFLQLAFAPKDLGYKDGVVTISPLFDAFMTFDHLRDVNVRVGRFKPFYSRQFIAPWGGLSFVDRAVADVEFRLERDTGVDIGSEDLFGLGGVLAYHVGVFAGQGNLLGGDRRWSPVVTGRLEFRPLGGFDAFQEPDLERTETPKLALAVAGAYQDAARFSKGVIGDPLTAYEDVTQLTLDGMFKWAGFSATGAAFGRVAQADDGVVPSLEGPVDGGRTGFGGFFQVGYLMPFTPVEIATRVEQTLALGDNSGLKEQGGVALAISYYPFGHDLKVQADVLHRWLTTDIAGPGDDAARVLLQLTL